MTKKALAVLVGTNPLNVYIILSYFKRYHSYKNFILLFSEDNEHQMGTKRFAEKIKTALHLPSSQVFLVGLKDVGNVQQIIEDLETSGVWHNFEEVHLNYKPGTKSMVVAVYNFLKNWYREKFSASYLDTRKFKIVYDNGDIFPTLGDLRSYFFLDIKTLLKLVSYEKLKVEIWKEFLFKEPLMKIKELVIEKDRVDEFLAWIENPFRKIFKNEKDLFKTAKRFKDHITSKDLQEYIEKFEHQTPAFIWEILESFPEDKQIVKGKKVWIPDERIKKEEIKERVKYTVEFLDGVWLEWYVYGEIRENLEDLGLREGLQFGVSLKAQKEVKPFELDLFIINGYQLIGISVTSEDKTNICKLKGFEIIHRVKQIGGEEGRAVLITGMSRDKALETQRDLSFIDGSLENKIVIYGKEDWKDIGVKLLEEIF